MIRAVRNASAREKGTVGDFPSGEDPDVGFAVTSERWSENKKNQFISNNKLFCLCVGESEWDKDREQHVDMWIHAYVPMCFNYKYINMSQNLLMCYNCVTQGSNIKCTLSILKLFHIIAIRTPFQNSLGKKQAFHPISHKVYKNEARCQFTRLSRF